MKRIYFAHPKLTYNTIAEKKALRTINKIYPDCCIIDPNTDLGELGPRWETYLKIVRWSDIVVILENLDGTLGKGTDAEYSEALEYDIPTLVVRNDRLLPIHSYEMLDSNSWKTGYSRVFADE